MMNMVDSNLQVAINWPHNSNLTRILNIPLHQTKTIHDGVTNKRKYANAINTNLNKKLLILMDLKLQVPTPKQIQL
jgi:hypothetical protein